MTKNEKRFGFFCVLIVVALGLILFLPSTSFIQERPFPLTKSRSSNLYLKIDIPEQHGKKPWFNVDDLSGEYDEIPDLFPRRTARFHYNLDEIFFALTSNSERMLDTIHEVKFWSQHPSIECLITFDERDLRMHGRIQQWIRDQGVRCRFRNSTIKRFEERYFELLIQSWNIIQTESLQTQWLALCDDDTLWFVGNLLHLLEEYNASELIYLGNISDRLESVQYHGDHFAYGGSGILLSRPLHRLLVRSWDQCHRNYSSLYGGDEMVGQCVVEVLKVNLTRNPHFHQFDHEGDLRGYLQSGINGIVAFHHLFALWEPYPPRHSRNESQLMSYLAQAYEHHQIKFLKRYRRYNQKKNQTYLFTLGHSFSIIDQIITGEQFNHVERTWCCSRMTSRLFRVSLSNQLDWFFLNVTEEQQGQRLRSIYRSYPPQWLPLPSLVEIQFE